MLDLLKINGQIELETFHKAFKIFNKLSARQVKKESTELIMLLLDYDQYINRAIFLANNYPEFQSDYYKPLVEARMQLPKHLYNDPSIKLVGKLLKAENRGRLRKNKGENRMLSG